MAPVQFSLQPIPVTTVCTLGVLLSASVQLEILDIIIIIIIIIIIVIIIIVIIIIVIVIVIIIIIIIIIVIVIIIIIIIFFFSYTNNMSRIISLFLLPNKLRKKEKAN